MVSSLIVRWWPSDGLPIANLSPLNSLHATICKADFWSIWLQVVLPSNVRFHLVVPTFRPSFFRYALCASTVSLFESVCVCESKLTVCDHTSCSIEAFECVCVYKHTAWACVTHCVGAQHRPYIMWYFRFLRSLACTNNMHSRTDFKAPYDATRVGQCHFVMQPTLCTVTCDSVFTVDPFLLQVYRPVSGLKRSEWSNRQRLLVAVLFQC